MSDNQTAPPVGVQDDFDISKIGNGPKYDHKHRDPTRVPKPKNMSNRGSGCLATGLAEKIASLPLDRQLLTVKNSEDVGLLNKLAELTKHDAVKTAIAEKLSPVEDSEESDDGYVIIAFIKLQYVLSGFSGFVYCNFFH